MKHHHEQYLTSKKAKVYSIVFASVYSLLSLVFTLIYAGYGFSLTDSHRCDVQKDEGGVLDVKH